MWLYLGLLVIIALVQFAPLRPKLHQDSERWPITNEEGLYQAYQVCFSNCIA